MKRRDFGEPLHLTTDCKVVTALSGLLNTWMAIASDIDKCSRYRAGKLPRAHLPDITIRGLPRGVRRAYLITTDWFLKRRSANGDRLLECRKDGGEIFRMAGAIAVQAFNKAESVIGTLD